jgi:hypothetical protein
MMIGLRPAMMLRTHERQMFRARHIAPAILSLFALLARAAFAAPDSDYERPPVHYSDAEPTDPVTRLKQRIERGEAKLQWSAGGLGYLPAVLRELDIPVSSQGLVFAKRSLQARKISPKTPRAIYFNDDAYVGFVQDGGMLELAGTDPKLGAVFYTIDQTPPPDSAPGGEVKLLQAGQLVREFETCLSCHDNDVRHDIPGLKISSVFPDVRGNAIVAGGFGIVDHTTPLEDRFGGWYLTGSTGGQSTRGNRLYARQRGLEPPKLIDDGPDGSVADADGDGVIAPAELASRFDPSAYASPHSDVVALMVLEHQVEAHNRLTHAAQATLRALHDEKALADALGEKLEPGKHGESTLRRVNSACEPLVEYLLFRGEARLTAPVSGTSSFAADFAARGPRDSKGRSLRELDLKTRLFRYPLSYLVYSPTFGGLPEVTRDRVYRRLWEVLSGADTSKPFAHLSDGDRGAIIEILRATMPGLPAEWTGSPGETAVP